MVITFNAAIINPKIFILRKSTIVLYKTLLITQFNRGLIKVKVSDLLPYAYPLVYPLSVTENNGSISQSDNRRLNVSFY